MTTDDLDLNHETEICTCECHKDGVYITESLECCDQSGSKYISEDGVVDIDRFTISFRLSHNGVKPTITNKNGEYYWVHGYEEKRYR